MTRIERITNMESLFDKSEEVVKRLEAALDARTSKQMKPASYPRTSNAEY